MLDAEIQPLLDWLIAQSKVLGRPWILGINGPQGSGKSTLARALQLELQVQGWRVAFLSLDDLYLSSLERQRLAQDVHPLLRTRGVPGTHDVARGISVFQDCLQGRPVELPRFNKAEDEPYAHGDQISADLDLLIFEGWCTAVPPQSDADLVAPINALEAEKDADGCWRLWVNQQLSTRYASLFALIDRLVYLQIPDWSAVGKWRAQQEQDTAAQARGAASKLMNHEQLMHFIAHFERLSRWGMEYFPSRADYVRQLDFEHRVLKQGAAQQCGAWREYG